MYLPLDIKYGAVPGYCWFRYVPCDFTTLRDGARGGESWYDSWDKLATGIQIRQADSCVVDKNWSIIVRTGVVPMLEGTTITPVVLVAQIRKDYSMWRADDWLRTSLISRYGSLSELPLHIPVPSGPGPLPDGSVQNAMWKRFFPKDLSETSSLAQMRYEKNMVYFPPLRYAVRTGEPLDAMRAPLDALLVPPVWEDLL